MLNGNNIELHNIYMNVVSVSHPLFTSSKCKGLSDKNIYRYWIMSKFVGFSTEYNKKEPCRMLYRADAPIIIQRQHIKIVIPPFGAVRRILIYYFNTVAPLSQNSTSKCYILVVCISPPYVTIPMQNSIGINVICHCIKCQFISNCTNLI